MNGEPPDARLTDITSLIRYGYDETAELVLLPTHSKYPGDYRTADQILRDSSAGLGARPGLNA